MMSASAISAAIRAKKKKMEEEAGAVKLSGIPQDATDAEVVKGHEAGEMLSENKPMERDESPSLESEMADEKKAQPYSYPEDPKQVNQPADGPVEDRKAKVRKMLARMGK
jgi:hypothetical protein